MIRLKEGARFIRSLPGRVRIEIFGLKKNKNAEYLLCNRLQRYKGIRQISPCIETGRVLILYQENEITLATIFNEVKSIESRIVFTQQQHLTGVYPDDPNFRQTFNLTDRTLSMAEVASAHEGVELKNPKWQPSPEQAVPEENRPYFRLEKKDKGEQQMPLPLALSVGGLGLLGVKQLVAGRSALAQSSGAFHLAALVSAVSGYPVLKHGFQRLTARSDLNRDLILGAAALGLALARENLIVLAGLSILQFLKWEKSNSLKSRTQPEENSTVLSPEINSYVQRTGKAGLLAAGAAWAFNGKPLTGLAVLLAANPRAAALPAEYAWDQAEHEARKQGYEIPAEHSLAKLAQIKTVVFEDTALMFGGQSGEVQCIPLQGDEHKLWRLAASLLKKTSHPWRAEVLDRALALHTTIRTAYKIQETPNGVQGEINSSKMILGNLKLLEENGIDYNPCLLEIKRKIRKGYQVECLANGQQVIGLFLRPQGGIVREFNEAVSTLRQHNLRFAVLTNSLSVDQTFLANSGIDVLWSDVKPEEEIERLAILRQQDRELLMVTEKSASYRQTLPDSGILTIPLVGTAKISQTIAYARTVENMVHRHFLIAKIWNIIGSMLAFTSALSAPLINLAGDALTLVLLARSKRGSENPGLVLPVQTPSQIQSNPQSELRTIPWHALSVEETLQRLQTEEVQGLSKNQIKNRRKFYGLNQLEQKKPTPWLLAYLAQFKEFTTLVVLGTSALAFLSGNVFDGLAMGAILLANAAVGMVQERKAEKVIETLDQYQPPHCKVNRDQVQAEILGTELVPGDVISLEAGERVPADIRLIRAWNLEANEGALTGESVPVAKNIECVEQDCPLAERYNMLFMGTDVTRGKGLGVVVSTGMQTEFGYLMSLMKEQDKLLTPLHEKVTRISKIFVKGAALAGGIVLMAGLLRGRPITEMITSSITLAASAVPEGLPVTITIALSAGIYRMSKQNALIRKLSALETLGRTTVICTDKTGTLTKNEMTVRKISSVNESWEVTGEGYDPSGQVITAKDRKIINCRDQAVENRELKQLMQIAMLCNNTRLEQSATRWLIKGDPTEGALITMSAKYGLWPKDMLQWHRVHEVPFDSNSGTMSVVCRDKDQEQECYLLAKGAVETIIDHCRWYQQGGEVLPLTDEIRQRILQQNSRYARKAFRILGFAYSPTEWQEKQSVLPEDNLIYVGLVGMMDPPKPEVEKSIREAYALGVSPVMITGDHPVTAIAVAKELGLGDKSSRLLTGLELDQLSDEELAAVVEKISIFARVTPEHKLMIVKAYQQRGHIVAMTGDGINDTPAIKQANVGIAMGETGTEVTKATADMVLKKDHFGSILEGVKEGRTIIGNIRRAIGCLLTGNLAEILVSATAVIIGLPMPLVPIQILLMNLLTDAIPAMVLAVNPGCRKKQTQKVDIIDQELSKKVITRGILLGVGSLGLFAAALAAGQPLAVAQTVAFTTLVTGQLAQTLSWRREGTETNMAESLRDRYLLGGLTASSTALLAALYLPPVARFFHSTPLGLSHWLSILLVAGVVDLLSKLAFSPLSRNFLNKRDIRPQIAGMCRTAACYN